jgi:hypothetical protein
MTLKRYDGAAFVDIAAIKRYDGAAFVDLTLLKRYTGGVWVDITLPGGAGDLSATVSPAVVSKTTHVGVGGPTVALVTTLQSASVSVIGGNDPYTYAWTFVSGDSAVLCNSPTSSSTQFHATIHKNNSVSAIWRCTVTDDDDTTVTVDVTVNLAYEENL